MGYSPRQAAKGKSAMDIVHTKAKTQEKQWQGKKGKKNSYARGHTLGEGKRGEDPQSAAQLCLQIFVPCAQTYTYCLFKQVRVNRWPG